MDLIGSGWKKNTPQIIKTVYKNPYIRYNWTGWSFLVDHLDEWGVDISRLAGDNSGNLIPRTTCQAIAEAIKSNIHTLPQEDQDWLRPHIPMWRWGRNYRQY